VETDVLEHAIEEVFFARTRWKMETYHIFIKDNATSRIKL